MTVCQTNVKTRKRKGKEMQPRATYKDKQYTEM